MAQLTIITNFILGTDALYRKTNVIFADLNYLNKITSFILRKKTFYTLKTDT
jgi:hypothetical protein